MKSSLAIAFLLVLVASSYAANLPFDLQGDWIIGASWGIEPASRSYCPRAVFDVDGNTNIQFYYEFVDKIEHEILSNRSFYEYLPASNQLRESFTEYKWTWDILYYNYTEGALVLTQNNNQTGMMLINNFQFDRTLLSFLSKIAIKLNLVSVLPRLTVFPEENCQADNLPLHHGLDSRDLTGMWWYGGVFSAQPASAYQCNWANITAYQEFQLIFRWGTEADLRVIPRPGNEALMVSLTPYTGAYAGTVNYFAKDKSFFVWSYTTYDFGIILSKERLISDAQFEEVRAHFADAGYTVQPGYNLKKVDNTGCV